MSYIYAMKIHQKNKIFANHYRRAMDALEKGESIRVTTKVATAILLNYPIIQDLPTHVRNIGAGVKELYLKKGG